jgi:uncharacterized protein (DUF2252 family)
MSLPNPLSAADRAALGAAARKRCPRSGLNGLTLHASSSSPQHDPLALLRASEKDRVQSLVAIKHDRMAASPFGFFRGAVCIMAADLAARPNTGLLTQLCGDAHISNLGAFAVPSAGLAKGASARLTFDINDFDETIRGPFEFDLKRLATSLILGGRGAGIKSADREEAVLHFTGQYRRLMHKFAAMPIVALAGYQIHRLADIDPMPAILAQAERSTPAKILDSLTEPAPTRLAHSSAASSRMSGDHRSVEQKSGKHPGRQRSTRIFKSMPPDLKRVTGKERSLVLASLGPYALTLQPERRHFLAQYIPLDVAFKVVGTGSVGLRDYVIYLEGTHSAHSDPLFLQIKQEAKSAYAPYLPDGDTYTHQGHRVVDGQRAMQLTSDPFLGYTTVSDAKGQARDFLVRQLNDHKAALDLTTLNADGLLGYADLCGEIFARGHARAGDPVAIAAYLGNSDRFDHAILGFAHAYADKTEQDWTALKKSLKRAS